jgi:very-short-patch-repair endonuclease
MRLTLRALQRSGWRVAAITPLVRAMPKARRREGPTPHDILWDAVRGRYPRAVREYEGAVPGRRYRIDIALVAPRLAIEVDGWEWHGKHKGDFARDRERQNLLMLNGWRVLRFTARQINQDLVAVMSTIHQAIEAGRRRA